MNNRLTNEQANALKEEIFRVANLREFAESHGIRKGRGIKYFSPFRSESDPSFTIVTEKGREFWKDFGGEQKSGDIISYCEILRNIGYKEALIYIAEYYRIDIDAVTGKGSGTATPATNYKPVKLTKAPERKADPVEYKPIETDSTLFHERAGIYQSNGATLQESEALALRDIKDAVIRTLLNECRKYSEHGTAYLANRGISIATAQTFEIGEIQNVEQVTAVLTERHDRAELELSGLFKEGAFVLKENRLLIPYIQDGRYIHLKGRYLPEPKKRNATAYNPKITLAPELLKKYNVLDISVSDAFKLIKGGSEATDGTIKALREKELTKEEKKALKAELPVLLFSGTYKFRRSDGIKHYNGLICIDFDHLEDITAVNEAKEKLKGDPYTYAVFISPSGKGLKLIARFDPIDTTEITELDAFHKGGYNELESYYLKEYGLKTDPQCKDFVHGCFLSHDPEIYVNQSADIWTGTPVKYRNIARRIPDVVYNETAISKARQSADKELYICEGEFDTIVMHQDGLNAVGLVSAEQTQAQKLLLYVDKLKGLKVKIVTDNDKRGREVAEYLKAELTERGVYSERIELPEGMDISDYYLQLRNNRK